MIQQFTAFCKITAANAIRQDGSIRFSYGQLRKALVQEDEEVNELFDKCLQFANIIPNSLTRKTLKLAFINIHMTYKLITRELIDKDESVMDLKTLFIEQLDTE